MIQLAVRTGQPRNPSPPPRRRRRCWQRLRLPVPPAVRAQSGQGRQCAVTDTSRYADSFRLLDTDGDGKVSATELIQMMRNLGENVTDEAAAHAIEIMDTDGDGLVSLEEFSRFQWAHDA